MANEQGFLGAAASTAGDEFHEQWVARELLRLLEPGGDIISIKVEGVPEDDVHLDLGEHAQAVDVTLTKGDDIARRYEYLQLKYSPSHPTTNWSWSRLTTPKTKAKPFSSVLGKLAQLMLSVEFAGTFSIVSNQPLDPAVVQDITALSAGDDHERADTLSEKLGLDVDQLHRFLSAWDLDGFGEVSRLQLQTDIVRRLADTLDASATEDSKNLQYSIRRLIMPEGRREAPLTRETLLVWLGAGAEEIFFPAPSRISPPSKLLHREIATLLALRLRAPVSRPLRLHADGGCGKTSLVDTLSSTLPLGSEVITYDCYGGGLFLASDEKRHSPQRAFTQVANELAARLRTPFVVRRNGSLDAFSAFKRRVRAAAEIVAARGPDALLVLTFDAVDNARIGALHWGEPCFLDELAAASGWPANVRIVVTCRTSRLAEVGDAQRYEDFEVHTFDLEEVAGLVSLWHPGWSRDLSDELHGLTGGNPRRLVYAIEGLPEDGQQQAIARLLPRAVGIDPLFEKRVDEADVRLGGVGRVWPMLSALARLPRPIPADMLALVADLKPADVLDIANDVGGIVEHAAGWSFHDEDFEHFVDERTVDGATVLLDRAATLLSEHASTNAYAALALGEALASAGRLDELYAQVINPAQLPASFAPAEAEFVRSQRLALGLRACQRAGDIGRASALLIAAGEATNRQQLIDDLIANNLDLSVLFEPGTAMRLVMTGRRHTKKRATLRIALAARLVALDPAEAKGHFRWWQEYLSDNRLAEASGVDIKARDIVDEYRFYATVRGEAAAFERLFDWRPKELLEEVFRQLATMGAGSHAAPLIDAMSARPWTPTALAPLLAAALLAGADFGDPTMERALERLAAATPARWSKPIEHLSKNFSVLHWHEAALFVCERAAAQPRLHGIVATILNQAFPLPTINDAQDLYRLRSAGAVQARAIALREYISDQVFVLEGWLPPKKHVPQVTRPASGRRDSFRQPKREKSSEEYWNETRAETLSIFTKMLEGARATRSAYLGNCDSTATWDAFDRAFRYGGTYDSRPRESNVAVYLARACLLHITMAGVDTTSLREPAVKLLKSWQAASDASQLSIVSALLLSPRGHNAGLEWLVATSEAIGEDALPASERAKLLARCARMALPVDTDLARTLFERAVESTASVDYEALSELAACRAVAEAGLGGERAQRVELAERLADAAGAVVVALDLGGDFAWGRVARAVAAADLTTGLGAVSRLQDIGIANFETTLPAVLGSPAATFLTVTQRFALGHLSSGQIGLAELSQADAVPECILERTLRDRLNAGDPVEFFDELNAINGLPSVQGSPAVSKAEETRRLIVGWRGDSDHAVVAGKLPVEPRGDRVLDSSEAIESALAAVRSDDGRIEHHHFLRIASRISALALRVPFLELARKAGGGEGAFGMALPDILADWSAYPPVRRWADKMLPHYIVASLPNLFEWDYEDTKHLEGLLEATGLSKIKQGTILLDAIAHHADGMPAGLIFALVGVVAARGPADTRNGLLDDLLNRVMTRTGRAPVLHFVGTGAPEDVAACVARTVFTATADVDRRIRWRATHAASMLAEVGDPAFAALVELLSADDEQSFAAADFYVYAAREQVMMVLWRATKTMPEAVAPFAKTIIKVLRASPHVIIRELGRSILLDLQESGAVTLTQDDTEFVEALNRTSLLRIEPNRRSLRSASFLQDPKKRPFHFDTMDTIRYWYQRPAALFGLDMEDFLDRIEAWIHGRWGYTDDVRGWTDEPRSERIQAEERHVSNRHGNRPMIERLTHYLEWTGMMLAVGELIETHPLIKDTWEDDFLEWVGRSMPTIGPAWLSDLRTAPPMAPRFWRYPLVGDVADPDRDAPAEDDLWPSSVRNDVFDQEVGLADADIVVAADFGLTWSGRTQAVVVRSALVTPETADALAQALHTASDRMDFLLPGAEDEDQAIEHDGFELLPWLRYEQSTPRADRDDLARGAVSGIPVRPSSVWLDATDLSFDASRSVWHGERGVDVMALSLWGDDETRRGGGWRVTAKRDFLMELLRRSGKSLIVHVEVARKRPRSDFGKTQWRLYILDQDGSFRRIERTKRGLGPYLVRREGLNNTVDTYARWLLHRIAELDALRPRVEPQASYELQHEVDRLCGLFRTQVAQQRW